MTTSTKAVHEAFISLLRDRVLERYGKGGPISRDELQLLMGFYSMALPQGADESLLDEVFRGWPRARHMGWFYRNGIAFELFDIR